MDFLGIGLPELVLILVIVLLVLGPKDMVSTARRLARTIRLLTQSEFWRTTREAWKMAQELPNELLRESGLDEARDEMNKMGSDLDQWKREIDSSIRPDGHSILPPSQTPPGDLIAPEADSSDANQGQSTRANE